MERVKSQKATLAQLAELVGGTASGDNNLEISGAEIIRDAQAGQITFATKPEFAEQLALSNASAVVVPPNFQPENIPYISVENVNEAFHKMVRFLYPNRIFDLAEKPSQPCDSFSHLPASCEIAEEVTIAKSASIGEHVTIGKGTVIHAGVTVMAGTVIGENVTIFPNCVLYENTIVEDRCILHAGVVLGAYGFGYDSSGGTHQLSSQIGYVHLERDVEVGASSCIDRGTFGATMIGEGTKLDNLVQIGHNCRIGKHNLICSQVGIAGSCSTEDYVVMGGQVGVADHVHLVEKVMIAAQSGIMADVTEAGAYMGSPIKPIKEHFTIVSSTYKLPAMRKEFRNLRKQLDDLEQEIRTLENKDSTKPNESGNAAA